MPFSANLSVNEGAATIELSGQLDAANASTFQKQIESAATQRPERLVLLMPGLEYMASAGLRALVFAKQKMGPGVAMYVVGAQPQVMNVIKATGFDRSIVAVDTYDAAVDKR